MVVYAPLQLLLLRWAVPGSGPHSYFLASPSFSLGMIHTKQSGLQENGLVAHGYRCPLRSSRGPARACGRRRRARPARAENRRFGPLSAPRPIQKRHIKPMCYREMRRALNRPKRARTVSWSVHPIRFAKASRICSGVGPVSGTFWYPGAQRLAIRERRGATDTAYSSRPADLLCAEPRGALVLL